MTKWQPIETAEKFRLLEVDRYLIPNDPSSGKLEPIVVAETDDIYQIMHYEKMYSQDGPVRLEMDFYGEWIEMVIENSPQ